MNITGQELYKLTNMFEDVFLIDLDKAQKFISQSAAIYSHRLLHEQVGKHLYYDSWFVLH